MREKKDSLQIIPFYKQYLSNGLHLPSSQLEMEQLESEWSLLLYHTR